MSHVFCFSFSLGPWKFSKGSLLYETKAPLRGERIVEGFPKTMGLYTQLAYHPVEGSHVCVVGEGACILFPEPGLSHFNLSLPPHCPWAEEKEKGPLPSHHHPTVRSNVSEIVLQVLLKIDCEREIIFIFLSVGADKGV